MSNPQPEILDLFCCAGGATRGYQEAGFRVTGVDIVARPEYPGEEFHQGDAVEFVWDNLEEIRSRFAFVHASPPCQGEGAPAKGTNKVRGNNHPRLIEPTRAALEALNQWDLDRYYPDPEDQEALDDELRAIIRRHRRLAGA